MILALILGLAVIVTAALVYRSRRWGTSTAEMHAKLPASLRHYQHECYRRKMERIHLNAAVIRQRPGFDWEGRIQIMPGICAARPR